MFKEELYEKADPKKKWDYSLLQILQRKNKEQLKIILPPFIINNLEQETEHIEIRIDKSGDTLIIKNGTEQDFKITFLKTINYVCSSTLYEMFKARCLFPPLFYSVFYNNDIDGWVCQKAGTFFAEMFDNSPYKNIDFKDFL
jgi:hypothetical protein